MQPSNQLQIEHVGSSLIYRTSMPTDKTTIKLAATIIAVMILHGLHTDSTYQSPLRETFVKDIREDFSKLVHCNLV